MPELAILDLVMPRLGGTTTALKLRERFPQVHVLFTSGYSESFSEALLQIPRSHYLQKPYSPMSLARVLREILGPGSGEKVLVEDAGEEGQAINL